MNMPKYSRSQLKHGPHALGYPSIEMTCDMAAERFEDLRGIRNKGLPESEFAQSFQAFGAQGSTLKPQRKSCAMLGQPKPQIGSVRGVVIGN